MYEYYTINHIALMTNLTSRTIRNYMKSGLLEGELMNGVWHFFCRSGRCILVAPFSCALH